VLTLTATQATTWGVDAILTDVTKTWLDLRAELAEDYTGVMARLDRSFFWRDARFYAPMRLARRVLSRAYLEHIGGPFVPREPESFPVLRAFLRFEGGFWTAYGRFMMRMFKF
jgi:hypothetical protein